MIPARADSHRLATLVANGQDWQWSADEIDWREPVVVPAWFPRRTYVAAISQLYHGELATAEACRRLLAALPGADADARACLEIQIRDETRHAEVYQAYLARLGDIAPPEPAVTALLEGGRGWRDPDLGIMLAYHVLLEGEALQIQHGFATWLPCPLFRALNARIVVDEARHVGFGKIVLPARLAGLPAEERYSLFSWVRDLWHDCALPVMERFRAPAVMTPRICRKWLESRWRRQVRSLAAIGLIEAGEIDAAARLRGSRGKR
jgi:hypothetical protein